MRNGTRRRTKSAAPPAVLTVIFAGGALLAGGTMAGCSPATVVVKKVLHESKEARARADAAYPVVLSLWRAGRQGQAEELCAQARQDSPNHQGLAFFEAACARSRFDVATARPLFTHVRALGPNTPEGRCADAIIALDELRYQPGEGEKRTPSAALTQSPLVYRHFGNLRRIAEQNSSDPLLLWMLAVECRAFDRNAEGVTHYQTLLARIHPDPGPALVHQTYANLLDALKRPNDALPQRRLAVQLEPAPWSYDGLALTLCDLGRYEEANRAHETALNLAARTGLESANYWRNWAFCLAKAGEVAGGKSRGARLGAPDRIIPKIEQALRFNPDDAVMWNLWGICLEKQNKAPEALPKYQRAVALDPNEADFRDNMAHCLARIGRRREAAALSPDTSSFGPVTSLPERTRLRIYRESEKLFKELFRKNKGGSVSMNDPAVQAFQKRHHLTDEEMRAIDAEGVAKRWYFTPAQRRRAHLPPLPH